MASKSRIKNITIFSAIITLFSFIYKLTLSYLTASLVLLIASISTLMIFICKAIVIKNIHAKREKKKKAYFLMFLFLSIYSLIFILFVVLKINGIDLSNNKTYEGIYGSLFILLLIIMFILSLIGLKGALQKSDIMVIGLKEMTFASALTDLVIIEEFVSRIILEYKNIDIMPTINSYFSLCIGGLLIIISIIMLFRVIKYKK